MFLAVEGNHTFPALLWDAAWGSCSEEPAERPKKWRRQSKRKHWTKRFSKT